MTTTVDDRTLLRFTAMLVRFAGMSNCTRFTTSQGIEIIYGVKVEGKPFRGHLGQDKARYSDMHFLWSDVMISV